MRVWLHEVELNVIGAVDLEETPRQGEILIINSKSYEVMQVCRRIIGEETGNFLPSLYGIVVCLKLIINPETNHCPKIKSNWADACHGGLSFYDNVRRDDTLLWEK